MGVMDRYNEKKKKQETPSSESSTGGVMKRYEAQKYYSQFDTSGVDEAYIDAFYNDWNNFSSSAEKDYGGLGWGNASSSYDSRSRLWNELSTRADTISAWAYKNRSNLTDEGYANLTKDLNEIRGSGSNILKSFQTEADYYSNWATEDEYNEWNKYSYITGLDDFAEKSKYVSTYRGGEKYNAFTNTYTDTGYDDIMYDYINRDENARATKAVNDISSNASFLGFDKSERREMTDDEISIFNYIYATQGKDAAYEYVDHITAGPMGLNARQRATETEEWENYAKENPFASSVFSVLEAPLKGFSYIGQATDYLDDGKIDQNAGYNKFSYINSAIRNQVTQDVEKNWGGVGSFAYQTGMSMADFLFTTAISGGNSALSLGIMGTGAAADTVIYAKDRGLSDTQAFALGTIAGAAEIVTEKISLDALLDATQLGKNALGYIAKNMLAEGSEEVASSAINLIADVLISRDKSEWREAINAYMAVGMSDKEAFWHAVGDQALSLGLDFIGGAVSGGVMGGGGVTFNAINTAYQGSEFKGFGADLTREALEINPENLYAQKMQGKIDNGKTLSNYQLGKLFQQNESELISQDKVKIKSAVEASLTELGETGNISKLADIVTKYAAGEELTYSEKYALKKNQNALQVLSDLDPGNDDSGWTGKIGTERINPEVYSRNVPTESVAEAGQAEAVATTENAPVAEATAQGVISAPTNTVDQTATPTTKNDIPESTKMVSDGEHSVDVDNTSEDTASSLEKVSAKYGAQAKAMVRTYNQGQDVKQYDRAYQMAYDMGKSGVSLFYTVNSKSTAYLTDEQKNLAYEAGQAAAGNAANAQHEKILSSATGKTGRKKGTVTGRDVKIADLKKAFNDTQNRAYKILCTFAEATGVDIVLYKSEANADGYFEEAQGKFNRKDDKIYIDINAGLANVKDVNDLAKYTMLRTFSHEFTHFLEKYNAVWYNEFRKVVFETLQARGEDVGDLIETKQAQNPGMEYEKASREVVAEAMTDILPDSQFIETLANKQHNIFKKLHDMLKEFLADIKAYFKTIGHNPSREANALKEQVGEAVRYVDNIVKMFDEGALAAVENYQLTVAFEENTITVEETPVINEVVTDTEEVIPDTHSEEEQAPAEEKTVEEPAKVEEPVKAEQKPAPVEATDGLVIKQKETVSKQGEPSIEEREKAFKRKFAFLKKAGQVSVFHHGNVSLLTDGALAIRATDDEINFAHIEYSGIITERITKGTPLEKLLDNANKQITEAPLQGVSAGNGVYVFNVDGKQPIFDKKLLSKLDGNLLYIGNFAKGEHILKAVDLDGNVAGFLLSVKVKGEITDAEPSKLKSFSSKFLAQVSKQNSESKAKKETEPTSRDVYDEISQALYKTHPYEIGGFKFDIQYAAGTYHAHVMKVGAKSRIHTSDSIATYKEAVDYIVSYARTINLLKDGDTNEAEAPDVAPEEKPQKVQEVKEETKAPAEKAEDQSKTPSEKLADSLLDGYINIKNLVSESGKALTSKELYALADEAFGGTQAEGKYDRKDAYDAMELAVNKFLLNYAAIKTRFNNLNGNATQAVSAVKRLEHLLELLPTQNVRTQEMEDFQQFSTPPNIAYLAAWSANISAKDFVLEPSAGIGGLAVFAKAWGAEVAVNELSKRRLEVLRSMGFDHLFNENAEHIDNILPANISPSVVIMNPPFSSTAGRLKNNKTSNAEKHIDQALARLRDGGRLVAILGQGMNNADYYKYWDKLRKSFNIRANLSIDGSNYRKYGTTYGVQIVVIDKTGPQTGETVTGTFTDLTEIPKVLEGIRNDRSSLETSRTASVDDSIRESVSDGGNEHTDTGRNGIDERTDGSASDNQRNKNRKGSDGNEGAGNRTDVKRPEKSGSKKTERKDGGTDRDSGRRDSGDGVGTTESSISDRHQSELPLPRLNDTVETEEVSDDGVYATFVSPEIPVKGGKKHPAVLVESAAMAAVSMPKATYKVHLPADVIANNLSEAQLVTVTYAGQAHEQMLPDKRRKGFFIGDGTGVGKGRQIAGIILDNFMQGRKKAVWISKNNDLFGDAVRDWTATTGRGKEEVFSHSKIKSGGKITNAEGILFSTYDTLKSEKGGNRLEQIVEWLGEDFDGVIAFDEAHAMGNLFGKKSKFGKSKGSLVAQAGVELQRRLPNARIVYVSATAATEVDNLAYAERIGLWGPGTAFNNAQDFISKIGSSGLAAMELVIRDMKAMGSYVARSISYNGVNYDTVEHTLDAMQTEIYNTMSRAWQKTMSNVQNALETTGGKYNSTARQKALGNFYSSMQRFYNQVLTSMSMPSVIADMRRELDAGHSCVLQIVNTNEAQQNKKLAEAKANGDSLDDLDLTPRESLIGYLMNSFPTQMYEEYTDDDGNLKSRPVLDSKGNPVQNKEAIKQRDALIDEVNQMSIPDGPLEMLFDVFGTEMVAENTGRSRRVVPKKMSDGSISRVEERRTLNHRTADVQAFQDGKKRILVFSVAGGTGKSYHADRTEKNQQLRIHYVLQPGWVASNAVQGFGRTHRSNEASAPVYKLVTTNIKGQKRFTSTIARRLDQLGALTKGQRDTGSGMFGAKDNLETDLAMDSLREFYRRLGKNKIEGIDGMKTLERLGLKEKFSDEYGSFKLDEKTARDIGTFLNRILALEVDEQNTVFDSFISIYEMELEAAIQAGTLDTGMENVKADKIEVIDDKVIRGGNNTSADTHYIQAKTYKKPKVVTDVDSMSKMRSGFMGIYKTENGAVRAVYRIADKTTEWGAVQKQFRLVGPNQGAKTSIWNENTLAAKAKELDKAEWQKEWDAEVAKVPEYNEDTVHMLTGALLPIWNSLPQDGNTKVKRLITDKGDAYLGRVIDKEMIDTVLGRFDIDRTKEVYSAKKVMENAIQKGVRFYLTNGRVEIFRSRVSGEWRLEIRLPYNAVAFKRVYPELIHERISYQDRYFIPVGENGEALLERILADNPVRNATDDDVQEQSRSYLRNKDSEYMNAVKSGDMETAQRMVNERADELRAEVFAQTDVPTYRIRRGATPKKTIKVYKVFTMSAAGKPSALFVSSQYDLPVGVWLDAQDTFHFTDQRNGHKYVPSTKNPNTKGGATGRPTNVADISPEEVAELVKRGYLKKDKNGKLPKTITSLAYRPGWHAGDLPFFPQGGMQIEGSNYPNVHRYNQVVFECEMIADNDYTDYSITDDGRVQLHDMQKMPDDGSYKYSTNPMTQSNDLGAWYIGSSIKIVRALTQEECDAILQESGRPVQEWQAYQDAGELKKAKTDARAKFDDKKMRDEAAKLAEYEYEHRYGPLDLNALGYDPAQTDGGKKLLDAVTYDDDGNVIPLSQRFNPEIDDVRYQQRTNTLTDRDILEMASHEINIADLSQAEKDALSIFQTRLDKLKELQEKRAEQGRLYKEQQFGEDRDRDEAKATLARMHVLDGQIRKATADVLTVEEKEVLRRVLSKARKIVENQQRAHDKEILDRYRERRNNAAAIKKYRDRLRGDVDELSNWILSPDNKDVTKHVPDVLKNTVIPFLSSINFMSKRSLNGGNATASDKEFINRLTKLKAAIKSNIDAQDMYSGYNDLPDDFMDRLDTFITSASDLVDKAQGEFIINQMTAADLKELSQIVRTLKKYIIQLNCFHNNAMFKHVYDAGDNSIDALKALSNASEKTGTISNALFWQQMRPAYAFERFGEGGKSIYDELRAGQAKLAFNTKEIESFSKKAYTEKEVKEWEKTLVEFQFGGDTVKIPVSYIMSFYELYKDNDGRRHIEGDGIRVATYTRNGKKISDVGHVLTKGDIDNLIQFVENNPRIKEVADKLQRYMADQGGKWGNHVSIARFGEEKFTNPTYFPINSDGRHLSATVEEHPSAAALYALLNMSFTKSRKEGANNRIVLYSIFDVFANHMASMAQYNAMALPILDAIKWFNYKQVFIDNNGKKIVIGNLREQMDRVYGVPEENKPGSGKNGYAQNFIINIIKSFNGTAAQGTPYDSFGLKLLHKYNMAQVAYNIRVAIQQPMAITRAAMLIDYNSIRKGLSLNPATIKKNVEEMQKYSGIAAWKSLGFYDVNISRGLASIIKHDSSALEKIGDFGMWGAEKLDEWTWAAIWSACKEEVIKKKKLKPSDSNFFEEVTKLFEDVIYKTQVVDSILTKNEFMRDKGAFARFVGSFMSEATTNASMLLNAVDKYNLDIKRGMTKKQAWQKNKKMIGRTFYVYSVGAVLLAVMQSFADAWRDDDEYETYGEKWLDAFVGNVVDEIMPFNKLPIVSDVYDLAKEILSIFGVDTYGNPPQSVFMQWYDSLVKGTEIIYDKIMGENTNYTWWGGIYKLLQAASGATGIAGANAIRELTSAWNSLIVPMAPSLRIETYGSTAEEDRNALYEAMVEGDGKEVARIEAKYKNQTDINSAIRKALRDNDSRIREAAEAKFNGDIAEYTRITDEIFDEGKFKENDIVAAINAEISAMNEKPESEPSDKAFSRYKIEDYYTSITNGDNASAYVVKYDLIETEIANGKDRDTAEAKFNSDLTSYVQDEFKKGNITESRAKNMLSYAGKTKEEAASKVQHWSFKKNYPDYDDLSEKAVSDYYSDVKPAGISLSVYYGYINKKAKATGVDKNGDGKADSGTKKSEILQIIHSLPISSYQKDVLYRLNGWAESTLYQAPWH